MGLCQAMPCNCINNRVAYSSSHGQGGVTVISVLGFIPGFFTWLHICFTCADFTSSAWNIIYMMHILCIIKTVSFAWLVGRVKAITNTSVTCVQRAISVCWVIQKGLWKICRSVVDFFQTIRIRLSSLKPRTEMKSRPIFFAPPRCNLLISDTDFFF